MRKDIDKIATGESNAISFLGVFIIVGLLCWFGYYMWEKSIGTIDEPKVKFQNIEEEAEKDYGVKPEDAE